MKTPVAITALFMTVSVAPLSFAQVNDQRPTTNRSWSSFLGCWTPDRRNPAVPSVQRCVLPGARPDEVRLVTFSGEAVVLEETIVADGRPQAMSERGCTGERTTQWSQTAPRFFYRTTSVCTNGPRTTTSGIGTLVTIDQWLDVQAARADRGEQVRVVRYWRSMLPAPPPVAAELRASAPSRAPVPPVTVDSIVEASREVLPAAVEAWIAESQVRVAIDRKVLVHLDTEHVNPGVIDLMVAQAYPKKFEVRAGASRSSSSIGSLFTDDSWYGAAFSPDFYGVPYGVFGAPFYFGWSPFYRPYDFVPIGGGFDVAGGDGGGGAAAPAVHGQVVNGQGYTHVQPREAVATPSNRGSGGSSGLGGAAGADSAGSSGGGGSSAGSGGGSSGASPAGYSGGGGGGGTGLTAVPR